MARQPKTMAIQPPMIGATAGASANSIIVWARIRCASDPFATSRMTARPTAMPTPPAMPCTARQPHSCPTVLLAAAPTQPRPNSASPASSTTRRPSASEIAPCQRFITPNISR